jgi:hypothetical protein
MIVMIETAAAPSDQLKTSFEALLKMRIGVEMMVELHRPGALADMTEVEKRQKPKRLSDERYKKA